jgi:hypothetical protein
MLGNSSVSERRVVSQEGLSSMELVIKHTSTKFNKKEKTE